MPISLQDDSCSLWNSSIGTIAKGRLHHAALILSLESVFAFPVSLVWGTDFLTRAKAAGFGFIMAGVLVAGLGWQSRLAVASISTVFRRFRAAGS
ncbi:MAG: hypothetical protein M0Z41_16875 [Peptococcaceae bacterium]|jgi:protein-S-isoprenylcysteine O-methyltransferase Ste14|nr:hypothetical protein [Peptococcaceae bacterium]